MASRGVYYNRGVRRLRDLYVFVRAIRGNAAMRNRHLRSQGFTYIEDAPVAANPILAESKRFAYVQVNTSDITELHAAVDLAPERLQWGVSTALVSRYTFCGKWWDKPVFGPMSVDRLTCAECQTCLAALFLAEDQGAPG